MESMACAMTKEMDGWMGVRAQVLDGAIYCRHSRGSKWNIGQKSYVCSMFFCKI